MKRAIVWTAFAIVVLGLVLTALSNVRGVNVLNPMPILKNWLDWPAIFARIHLAIILIARRSSELLVLTAELLFAKILHCWGTRVLRRRTWFCAVAIVLLAVAELHEIASFLATILVAHAIYHALKSLLMRCVPWLIPEIPTEADREAVNNGHRKGSAGSMPLDPPQDRNHSTESSSPTGQVSRGTASDAFVKSNLVQTFEHCTRRKPRVPYTAGKGLCLERSDQPPCP